MKKVAGKDFTSVWDAIADSAEDAENLRVRAQLMDKIIAVIGRKGWTQVEAARQCGTTQPRMNDLMRGPISRFSLGALVKITASLGYRLKTNLRAA
jgi:predicted XRE-type DNA-binding protein